MAFGVLLKTQTLFGGMTTDHKNGVNLRTGLVAGGILLTIMTFIGY